MPSGVQAAIIMTEETERRIKERIFMTTFLKEYYGGIMDRIRPVCPVGRRPNLHQYRRNNFFDKYLRYTPVSHACGTKA
jgi:hypothetical protein